MTRALLHLRLATVASRTSALVAGLAVMTAAACGGNTSQTADSAAAAGPLGRGVGDNREAMDSGFAAASERLDSLQDAGRTPAQGLDSAAARVGGVTANEPGADTSQLYNNQRSGATSSGTSRPPQR